MEKDVLRNLHDAITKVLSQKTQGSAYRDALAEVDSIVSSNDLPSEELVKLGMNSSKWLRFKELVEQAAKCNKKTPHSVLKNRGLEDVLTEIKANIEKKNR